MRVGTDLKLVRTIRSATGCLTRRQGIGTRPWICTDTVRMCLGRELRLSRTGDYDDTQTNLLKEICRPPSPCGPGEPRRARSCQCQGYRVRSRPTDPTIKNQSQPAGRRVRRPIASTADRAEDARGRGVTTAGGGGGTAATLGLSRVCWHGRVGREGQRRESTGAAAWLAESPQAVWLSPKVS